VSTRSLSIVLVSPGERKRRKPRLPTHGPAFVRWRELVGRVERAEVHFDLVTRASEDRRPALGTERPPRVVARFAMDRHRVLGKDRGRVEKRPVMLATVEAMANTYAVGTSGSLDADVAAQAAAGESVHAAFLPLANRGSRRVWRWKRLPLTLKARTDGTVAKRQPRRAASIFAMSIFLIVIIASNARLAAARSGSVIAARRTRGVICQETPHLSLHQPHSLS